MQLTLTGRVFNPINQPVKATLTFVRKGTISPYYNQPTDYTTDDNGLYTININFGVYEIYIKTDKKYYLIAPAVSIDEGTTAETINDLIKQ